MTPELLLALMLTLECHSLVVNIPERRETVVKTVCVKVTGDTETAQPQTTKVAEVVPAKTKVVPAKTVTKKTTKRPIKKKSRKKYRKRS